VHKVRKEAILGALVTNLPVVGRRKSSKGASHLLLWLLVVLVQLRKHARRVARQGLLVNHNTLLVRRATLGLGSLHMRLDRALRPIGQHHHKGGQRSQRAQRQGARLGHNRLGRLHDSQANCK
jgi:hypothetical protein